MSEAYVVFLPAIIGLSFVGLIVLAIAAIQDSRHGGRPNDILRRVYIYLVSFITLLMVSSAVTSLVDLGLRAGVFTKADPAPGAFTETPPMLFFNTRDVEGAAKAPVDVLDCTNGCTLTEENRSDIASWQSLADDWFARLDANSVRARALVTPLSFLIIAGLVLIFHWRLVRKDSKENVGENNLTRSTYFTAMSFIWLVTLVVAGGMFLNTLLSSVIPGAGTSNSPRSVTDLSFRTPVERLIECASACNLDAETVATAERWIQEYDAWEDNTQENVDIRNRHNALSLELSFLLVSIPLFLYHFKIAWREKKQPVTLS